MSGVSEAWEQMVADLKREVDRVTRERDAVAVEVTRLQNEVVRLTQIRPLHDLDHEVERLQHDLTTARDTIASLETKLAQEQEIRIRTDAQLRDASWICTLSFRINRDIARKAAAVLNEAERRVLAERFGLKVEDL